MTDQDVNAFYEAWGVLRELAGKVLVQGAPLSKIGDQERCRLLRKYYRAGAGAGMTEAELAVLLLGDLKLGVR